MALGCRLGLEGSFSPDPRPISGVVFLIAAGSMVVTTRPAPRHARTSEPLVLAPHAGDLDEVARLYEARGLGEVLFAVHAAADSFGTLPRNT